MIYLYKIASFDTIILYEDCGISVNRPSDHELFNKLEEARKVLGCKHGVFANPAKAVGELAALNIRPFAYLHWLVKMALFGSFAAKFFDRMCSYALKILQQICSKMAHFSKPS